ncbi:MAG: class I SAM-dependent methyltransferase [Saprospiraceae bacterium]|nr:class I SAM-dependent methyltransferase [Saprospiraceae bacterium]
MEILGFSKVEILEMEDSVLSSIFYNGLGIKKLEEQAKFQKRNEYDIPLIEDFLHLDDKILDLGCGYGRILVQLLSKGYNVYGLDISAAMLEAARQHLASKKLSTKLIESDMVNTSFDDGYFNKIICVWSSFNHILFEEKQVEVLNEVYRLLAPGGEALFEIFDGSKRVNVESLKKSGFGKNRRLLKAKVNGDMTVVYIHDKQTFEAICEKSLFEDWNMKFFNINQKRKIVVRMKKANF